MDEGVNWKEYGLDYDALKENVEGLRGQQIEVQLLMQRDASDATARLLYGQAAATITAAEAVLRELDRFSDPTFDFEAAAKAQQAAATGASGASGAAPAKRSIGGGGSGKGKLGKFSAPGWASDKAISTHRFEAIKDGAVVFKLELGKRPFFVLGKQKELCHVVLEHGSISRQHAAIVHGQPPKAGGDDQAWLIDLESAHGTYMGASADKLRKIKPHVPYPLAPGAIVRIGKSSRVYKVRAAVAEEAAADKAAAAAGEGESDGVEENGGAGDGEEVDGEAGEADDEDRAGDGDARPSKRMRAADGGEGAGDAEGPSP